MVYVPLLELWLPILLSTIGVFFVSFVVHAIVNWHAGDQKALPAEPEIGEAIRTAGVPPGNYRFPYATSREMRSEETRAKFDEGPVGFLVLYPNGVPAMGKSLAQWALLIVVISVSVAYLCGRTLAAGTEYLEVFRVAGTVAFLAYAGAQPIESIFYARSWGATLRNIVDGLLYALVTAGFFAALWP